MELEIFFLCLSTILIAAAGYIINDYYDIKIDMINNPQRVILSNKISRRIGLGLHLLLNAIGVGICYFELSLNVALFVAFCAFLLWIYSNYLKRVAFWGNLCIAFLAFATLFMLSLYYQKNANYILFFGLFALVITLLREIIKDIEDVKGDLTFGCRTLPIILGLANTKNILYIILGLIFSLLLSSIIIVPLILYVYFLLFSFCPLLVFTFKVYKADKKKDFSDLSRYLKFIMLTGILGMVLV